jgi:ubiquitin-protein ligase
MSSKSKLLDPSIDKFNFDILLRDKYPFQPPLIMTKTRFCLPSLADGRDLLQHILPSDQNEWRPSMNLYELIQQIPNFIQEVVVKGQERKEMIGRFHLGLNYDMLLWLSNSYCRVFPCQ